MARHVPVNAAELLQLLQWKKAPLGQSGVERRRTVPLGEHKAVPLRGLRSVGVHPHHVEIQGCKDIQRRQGAADVSRRRAVHHIQRQQPGTRRRQCQVLNLCLFHPIHLSHFSARWPYFELSVLSISYQARAFNWRTVKNIGFSARLWEKRGAGRARRRPRPLIPSGCSSWSSSASSGRTTSPPAPSWPRRRRRRCRRRRCPGSAPGRQPGSAAPRCS